MNIEKSAVLSDCEKYRFELRRTWEPEKGLVNIIGLNPSTADASIDDPTIRRCIKFAQDWGYGGLIMTNLFAVRLTDSTRLHLVEKPNTLGAYTYCVKAAQEASIVVAAWGAHKMARLQGERVQNLLAGHGIELKCIKQTKPGIPWHPLYLKADLKPVRFEP